MEHWKIVFRIAQPDRNMECVQQQTQWRTNASEWASEMKFWNIHCEQRQRAVESIKEYQRVSKSDAKLHIFI